MSRRPPGGLPDAVGASAARKRQARRHGAPGLYFGLGTMGLVGWSIALPTVLGAALGRWLDGRGVPGHQWTLALLVAGLTLGCLHAWAWIGREQRAMHDTDKEEEPDDDGNDDDGGDDAG